MHRLPLGDYTLISLQLFHNRELVGDGKSACRNCQISSAISKATHQLLLEEAAEIQTTQTRIGREVGEVRTVITTEKAAGTLVNHVGETIAVIREETVTAATKTVVVAAIQTDAVTHLVHLVHPVHLVHQEEPETLEMGTAVIRQDAEIRQIHPVRRDRLVHLVRQDRQEALEILEMMETIRRHVSLRMRSEITTLEIPSGIPGRDRIGPMMSPLISTAASTA